MPPFEYKPFVNPYIGSISELMGKGDEAKAQALLRIGDIQAREAEQRGQAWGNAIQGIGNIASKTITDYNSPEARRQREVDKAMGIHRDKSAEMRSDIGTRVVPGERVQGFQEVDRPGDEATVAAGLGYPTKVRGGFRREDIPQSPATLSSRQGIPTIDVAPDDLEAYGRDPVGRYTTKNGLYDIKLAHSDLIAAGISLEVANMIAKQGFESNTIFSAAEDIAKKFRESQTEVRGAVAQMAISIKKADPNMSWDEALENTIGPATRLEDPDELEEFRVMFFNKSPEEKENVLRGLVDQWNRQGDPKVVGAGGVMYGSAGEPLNKPWSPPSPATEASLAREDYEKYVADETNKGTPAANILSMRAWSSRETAKGTELGTNAKMVGAPYSRINKDTGNSEMVQRWDDGRTDIVGVPLPTAGTFTHKTITDINGREIGERSQNTVTGETYFTPSTPEQYTTPQPAQLRIMSIQNQTALDQMQRLQEMFLDPTSNVSEQIGPVAGRIRSAFLNAGDAGLAIGQAFLGDTYEDQQAFAYFQSATAAFKNSVIKTITGAQMSEEEAKRILDQIPTEKDHPMKWVANLQNSIASVQDLENRMREGYGSSEAGDIVKEIHQDADGNYSFTMGPRSSDTRTVSASDVGLTPAPAPKTTDQVPGGSLIERILQDKRGQ